MPRKLLRALVASGAILAVPAAPASAAEIVVNTTADLTVETTPDTTCDAGGGQCTLREAIRTANVLPGPDVVTVPPGTYVLTVTGTPDNQAELGDLDLNGQVTINGAGARTTVIDGNGTDRVFHAQTSTAGNAIQGVTIRNGLGDASGGGGVLNQGGLTIADTAIRDNDAAGSPGGGINNEGPGVLTLSRSLVASHETIGDGAGISNSGTLTIENSTVSGNTTTMSGGGLRSTAPTNSPVQVNSTTFAGNSDNTGNTIVVDSPSMFQIRNSIVAGSCSGTLTSAGYNIETGATCPFTATGDKQSTDPQLGALGDYGGPTDTHMIAPTSPARDAADPDNCLPTDQRGANRPAGTRCDIGAVEWYPPPPAPPRVAAPASLVLDPAQAQRRPGDPNVVTATARNDDGSPAAGRTIRYTIVGPNAGAGTATTDANGVARIEWAGIREGTDTVNAYVDTDGNQTPDVLEPLASAQVTWVLPPPRPGRTMNIEPISGIVRVRQVTRRRGRNGKVVAAGGRVQRLTEAKQVSIATTQVDVRRGRVQMTTIADRRNGAIQKGEFNGGVFQTTQSTRSARPYTDVRLTESLICRPNRRGKIVSSRARSRKLWGRTRRGRYRTRGRHSVATVRGTIWLQKDTCRSTTTLVREGTVIVRDLAKRKNVRIKRGRRYVARARARR